jgi:hypothetical protein
MSESKVWFTSNDPETGAPAHPPRWMEQFLQVPVAPPPKPPLDPRKQALAEKIDRAIASGRSPWDKTVG